MGKSNSRDISIILLITVLIKVAYIAFAKILDKGVNLSDIDSLATIFYRNDSSWYEKIAVNLYPHIYNLNDLGYAHGPLIKQSEWAFFPQYPLMIRGLMQFSLSFKESGFILLILFSSLAAIGMYLFTQEYLTNRKSAIYCTLLLIVFPFNFYFSMMYSEALFFSLLIFSFIAIQKQKYFYLPFLIIPLVLTRSLGIVCLLPLYLFYLERERILDSFKISLSTLFNKKNILISLYFLSGPMAFLAYMIYQKEMTDTYFAFSLAQAGWSRKFMFPLIAFFRRSDFSTQFNSVYTIIVIIFWFFHVRKFPLSLNVLIFLCLFFPLSSGSVISMPRFISIIFPITIIAGIWLSKIKFNKLVLVFIFATQLIVFSYWLAWHPFSY
ncbi:MAG: hypothetical protein ACM3ME_09475 [Chloroflexota bacterium]|nr:hypothetical protein [Lentimicrobium sp.]